MLTGKQNCDSGSLQLQLTTRDAPGLLLPTTAVWRLCKVAPRPRSRDRQLRTRVPGRGALRSPSINSPRFPLSLHAVKRASAVPLRSSAPLVSLVMEIDWTSAGSFFSWASKTPAVLTRRTRESRRLAGMGPCRCVPDLWLLLFPARFRTPGRSV